MNAMAALDTELKAYAGEALRLEAAHAGRWVLFNGSNLVAVQNSLLHE